MGLETETLLLFLLERSPGIVNEICKEVTEILFIRLEY